MNSTEDADAVHEYASPPCFLHEIDPAYAGLPPAASQMTDPNVMRWRKGERERLLALRMNLDQATRGRYSDRIAEALDTVVGDPTDLVVSSYWPFRGEPDLRPWMEWLGGRGGSGALPVVVEKRAPMIFRIWRQGEPLERGVWNIPIPAAGSEVIPDVVIAPVVGFDRAGYRLGYGGGFFDRTLAALPKRPRIIGVGYGQAEIPTIHPMQHDIPMDTIVTENEVIGFPR